MKNQTSKAKLTEIDKKTILKNSNICTDSHGKGCDGLRANSENERPD